MLTSPSIKWHWHSKPEVTDIVQVRQLVKDTGVFSAVEIEMAAALVHNTVTGQEIYQFLFLRDGEGNLAGYTCFGEIPLTDKRFDLYWIAVAKQWQQQKLGFKLFSKTEQIIYQSEGQQIYAETSSTSSYEAARVFYQKNGMQEVARLPDFYKAGDAKVIYCKDLG